MMSYGTPLIDVSAAEWARFWTKVSQVSGCWAWRAANVRGYGHFGFRGKVVLAHRFAYRALVGFIPEDFTIDHLCRNPSCVNPIHMEAVTQRVNNRRGGNASKTACTNGHLFTPDNLSVRRGWRICKACQREHTRKWRSGRKAA